MSFILPNIEDPTRYTAPPEETLEEKPYEYYPEEYETDESPAQD